MSNTTNALTEDEQTCKPWQLPTFIATDNMSNGLPGTLKTLKVSKAALMLPTAVQLEEIQRQARDEGYQAGFAEGSQHMTKLLGSLERALQQADQEIAQSLLSLALEVARQMVQQSLKSKPEILLNTIREAIAILPHFNQSAHVVLHPEDAALVREGMGEQLSHTGWKIFEDPAISRGGARIETAHSQIDATLENRWQRIVASIGQDSSWIQE